MNLAGVVGLLGKALLTKKMVIWVLRRYAQTTDTAIDDHAVDLIDAMMKKDLQKMENAVKGLVEAVLVEHGRKIKSNPPPT